MLPNARHLLSFWIYLLHFQPKITGYVDAKGTMGKGQLEVALLQFSIRSLQCLVSHHETTHASRYGFNFGAGCEMYFYEHCVLHRRTSTYRTIQSSFLEITYLYTLVLFCIVIAQLRVNRSISAGSTAKWPRLFIWRPVPNFITTPKRRYVIFTFFSVHFVIWVKIVWPVFLSIQLLFHCYHCCVFTILNCYPQGVIIQSLDVLDFSVIHLSAYERSSHKHRWGCV